MIAVRIDEGGPLAWSAAQCLGLAGAGVAFDGVEGQVETAGAFQQANALVQQVVDLLPALSCGSSLMPAGRAGLTVAQQELWERTSARVLSQSFSTCATCR